MGEPLSPLWQNLVLFLPTAASWVLVLLNGQRAVPWVASFYWLWSVKNWVWGPLRRDSGLVTFALVLVRCPVMHAPASLL